MRYGGCAVRREIEFAHKDMSARELNPDMVTMRQIRESEP